MNFWTLIGSGNGVMLFFNPKQLDGTYYTAEVLDQLNDMAGLPNSSSILANNNGVYTNSVEGKSNFYQKIRNFILPTEAAAYGFEKRVFVNEDLSKAETLQFILDGNILDLIALPNTKELTLANDANGFLVKIVG